MNSVLKKIFVVAIDDQLLKGAKDLVMGYTNKTIIELMDWLDICYRQITPSDIMNDHNMQELYDFKELIEILFGQIEMGR